MAVCLAVGRARSKLCEVLGRRMSGKLCGEPDDWRDSTVCRDQVWLYKSHLQGLHRMGGECGKGACPRHMQRDANCRWRELQLMHVRSGNSCTLILIFLHVFHLMLLLSFHTADDSWFTKVIIEQRSLLLLIFGFLFGFPLP